MTGQRGREHVGTGLLGRGDQRVRAEAEHAGIPDIFAAREVFARPFNVRLLDEGCDLACGTLRDRRALADVSEAGVRMRGRNAERDEPAVARELCRLRDVGLERGEVLDQVIGCEQQERRIRAEVLAHMQRR